MTVHIPAMPRPSLHDKILTAGMRAMHAGGYCATSIERITAAAAAPKGSFYNHFPSKEALAVAALGEYFREHRRHLDELFREDGGTPLERLRDYFKEVGKALETGGFQRGCMIGNFSLEVSDQSPVLRHRVAELLEELTGAVERCLRIAQECGELDPDEDVRALAEFAVNSWEGAILRMKVDKTTRPLRLFQDFLFEKLLRRLS